MGPDGARPATRDTAMTGAFVHVGDDERPRPTLRPRLEPEPEPPRPRRATRATSSAPGSSSSAVFRGRDFFHTPELDQRMKKYLVRLANETANHLIRDTLEPEHTNLLWKPMASVKGIDILRGYEHPDREGEATRDATCLRGVAQVNASIEEFAMLFKLDTNRQLAEHGLLFNPDLLDMATLYSLVQPSGDHPRRYVGIKWCLVQSPSRFFRNRDFCYLECQKEFLDAHGRRGWVRSMHSIKMPCCPTLEKSHGIVRASLYRCGLIAVETEKPGVLDTTYTIEMDLKGHFPEIFQPKFLAQRIAALASIDRYLQQQRLSSSPLLGDLDIPKTKRKATCHHCFREFATFTKRYICRKCGEGVCKNCSDDWELDVPVIGRKKVRICTVCSAEARTCHATPRNIMGMGFGMEAEYARMHQQQFYGQTGRIRRSNSMPENYDYGESPFLRTAQEPPRSVHHTTTESMSSSEQIDPSEYFARQQQQLKQHHVRESQAMYRESDFATDLRDFPHGGIRGTTDLTGLWTEEDANFYGNRASSYQRPQPDSMMLRRESQPPQRQSTNSSRAGSVTFAPTMRSRAPTEASALSRHRDHSETSSNYGRNGHIPPSARYTVVGNRLERANSFDAGRQLEEQNRHQLHYQPSHQFQFQQQRQFQHHQIRDIHQRPYHGNSRQSNQPLNDVYSPNGDMHPSPSRSYRYQEDQSPNSQSQASLAYQQRHSNGRVAFQHQAAPPRNVALEFARQPQNGPPAQRNIALEFASQSQAQHTAPRNIALEFARQPQNQSQVPRNIALEFAMQPHSTAAPRNVALEFVKQQASSSRYQETPPRSGPKIPWQPQPHDYDMEPPRSPDLVGGGEPVEYVETDNGEWIASDHWEKGVLDVPDFELEGGEPLETRSCENCGAKQYVHEGIVESTCDCDIDDELTYQSTHSGHSSRDESRVSFRVEGNPFGASPTYSDLSGSRHNSFSSGKIKVSVDVEEVIPLLVERLSQQSLRNSFHHT